MSSVTLRPFGATMQVVADRPDLLRTLDAALADMPPAAGAGGSLAVRLTTHADHPGDPAWPEVSLSDGPDRLVLRCGSGSLTVDHATATAVVDVPESLAAVDDAVRCMVEGALSSVLIRSRRLHAIHSGLVESPGGRGVLLRGESGAGKSTLTYVCMAAGFAVASDDWVYAIAGRPAGHLYGYPWRMFLMPDTVRFFPELAGVEPVLHPSVDRLKVPVVPEAARQRVSADVDAVVFVSPDPVPGVRAVEHADAVERWWRSALPSERADVPAEWVDELLRRPCFAVGRGEHPSATADAIVSSRRASRRSRRSAAPCGRRRAAPPRHVRSCPSRCGDRRP